jgi:hypothetical protein
MEVGSARDVLLLVSSITPLVTLSAYTEILQRHEPCLKLISSDQTMAGVTDSPRTDPPDLTSANSNSFTARASAASG